MDTVVAENIKRLREEHSLTQEALAKSLGVNEIAIYKWEAGRLPVEYDMAVKIAVFFGISVEELYGKEAENKDARPTADSLPSNCKTCGGTLVHDYLGSTCKCENCGKKYAITDLFPDYDKYGNVIATITKANRILESKTELASADEADLLFKQAINECAGI